MHFLLNVSIVNPDDEEELALTLAGKKKKITRKLLIDFGLDLGLTQKQINGVFKRFNKSKNKTIGLIRNSFLSEEMQKAYINMLENRYKILLRE